MEVRTLMITDQSLPHPPPPLKECETEEVKLPKTLDAKLPESAESPQPVQAIMGLWVQASKVSRGTWGRPLNHQKSLPIRKSKTPKPEALSLTGLKNALEGFKLSAPALAAL